MTKNKKKTFICYEALGPRKQLNNIALYKLENKVFNNLFRTVFIKYKTYI